MSDPPNEGKTVKENKNSQFLEGTDAAPPQPGTSEDGAGDQGTTFVLDEMEKMTNSETMQVVARDGDKSKQEAAIDELSQEQLDQIGAPDDGSDGFSNVQGESNDKKGDDYHKPLEERIHQPNSFDVLLGRGRPFQIHRGNQAMLR